MTFLYVTYTTEFPVGSPDSRVIWTTPLPYSPDDRETTVPYTRITVPEECSLYSDWATDCKSWFHSRPGQDIFLPFHRDKDGQGVRLTTHLHVVSRLRMTKAKPLLPICLHSVYKDSFTLHYTITSRESSLFSNAVFWRRKFKYLTRLQQRFISTCFMNSVMCVKVIFNSYPLTVGACFAVQLM